MCTFMRLSIKYQLSDIYGAVVAKTTTSGEQKIGGSFQSANQRPRKMSEPLTETVTGNFFNMILELSN